MKVSKYIYNPTPESRRISITISFHHTRNPEGYINLQKRVLSVIPLESFSKRHSMYPVSTILIFSPYFVGILTSSFCVPFSSGKLHVHVYKISPDIYRFTIVLTYVVIYFKDGNVNKSLRRYISIHI